jgi:hypothetical protein
MMKVSHAPTPDVDLSVYVLAAIDEHLAGFQRIRDLLRAGCTIGAGERRALAADSVALAARYASAMSKALESAGSGQWSPPARRDTAGDGPFPDRWDDPFRVADHRGSGRISMGERSLSIVVRRRLSVHFARLNRTGVRQWPR